MPPSQNSGFGNTGGFNLNMQSQSHPSQTHGGQSPNMYGGIGVVNPQINPQFGNHGGYGMNPQMGINPHINPQFGTHGVGVPTHGVGGGVPGFNPQVIQIYYLKNWQTKQTKKHQKK